LVLGPRNQHILGILIDLGEEGAVSGNPNQQIPMILGMCLRISQRFIIEAVDLHMISAFFDKGPEPADQVVYASFFLQSLLR